MSELKQFTFFESYYKALKKLSPDEIGEIVLAMGAYFFEDQEIPELDGITGAVLEVIRPNISNSKARATSGKKGGESKTGANPKQTSSKPEANVKQNESKGEAIKDKELRIKDKGDIKKDSPTESRKNAFIPPTLEEVEDYCKERNSSVDPKQFYEYFNTGNWIDSKGQKVKNWKQKIITWEKYKQGNGDNRASTNPKVHNFQERKYTQDDFSNFEQMFARN